MSEKKEFKPRSVAAEKLFAENQRLQKKNYAHKVQIRGMQRSAELLKAQKDKFIAENLYLRSKYNEVCSKLWALEKQLEKEKTTC